MADSDTPDRPAIDWRAFTPEDSPKGLPDVMADPLHQKLASAELPANPAPRAPAPTATILPEGPLAWGGFCP